ncbi:MAG: NADH dehydrogenase (quinone) subunit D [Planctomycetota bacterium]
MEETITINIGPTHPATHGTFHFVVKMSGEKIVDCTTNIGYLHRAFEKSAEAGTYTQVIPYTDRLNYCSAMINNVAYVMAVEKLLNIEPPPRCQYIRVIICELSRIMDHLVCIGTHAVDIGALTNFWYFFQAREELYDLIEALCGARLTTTYTRIGGLAFDLPDGWVNQTLKVCERLPKFIDDVDRLLTNNPIFLARTKNIGAVSKEMATSYAFTGPCLRACGIAYDVRKAKPYLVYDRFNFNIPVGNNGDTYDRYLVRMNEMRESIKIVKQALKELPDGEICVKDYRITLPPPKEVYTTIEATINHFKIIIEGVKVPRGEGYSCVEAANGELGFYIVSDGSGKPYRVRVRPPCFPIFSAFDKMVKGHFLADLVAILSSLNIVAGELDR